MSPDRQPIVSGCETLPGFYVACGFSGHGFMFAPMTGLLLTEIILGIPTTLDVSILSLHRFQKGSEQDMEHSVV